MKSPREKLYRPIAIAGTDPTGAAGISIDITSFNHFGLQPAIAISAINAQHSQKVSHIELTSPKLLKLQLESSLAEYNITVIKIGMVGSRANANIIAEFIQHTKATAILDPVIKSSSGYYLGEEDIDKAIKEYLLPYVNLITPNLNELAILSNSPIADCNDTAIAQAKLLKNNVLIKGGHSSSYDSQATDILYTKENKLHYFTSTRINKQKRGTGCALSSAIAANLHKGKDLVSSIQIAKDYINQYIIT